MKQSSVIVTRLARGESRRSWLPISKTPLPQPLQLTFPSLPCSNRALGPTEMNAHHIPHRDWGFSLPELTTLVLEVVGVLLAPHHCFPPNFFLSSLPTPTKLWVSWPCVYSPHHVLLSLLFLTYSLSSLSHAVPWANSRTSHYHYLQWSITVQFQSICI